MKLQSYKTLLIVLPVISLWYFGLFVTIFLWYPTGLTEAAWREHVLNFSVVYLLWMIIFFAYSLFSLHILSSIKNLLVRLVGATLLCTFASVAYFYFQPSLLLTPRRFLLVHILISSLGIFLWYWILTKLSPRLWQRNVFSHNSLPATFNLTELLSTKRYSGFIYRGALTNDSDYLTHDNVVVVLPPKNLTNEVTERELFGLRRSGVRFIEFHDLYELLTRTVHLSVLSELWFIHSVDYSSHTLVDSTKRIIDLFFGLLAGTVFIATFPIVAILIKLTSRGPVFFAQSRVGQVGKIFTLYKYRTMTVDSSSNTWAHSDQKITLIGKLLRTTRLDELPQALNLLKGDMSIVGPRPEQVNIVEQLRGQIPYYDERHIVKPGLTGWAQLHVYASTLEETKHKLQYDLYYIKHRSLLFDAEIILKTIYNIISFSGR